MGDRFCQKVLPGAKGDRVILFLCAIQYSPGSHLKLSKKITSFKLFVSILLVQKTGVFQAGTTMMKDRLQQRLQSLKIEYENGQKMLADLEAKQANLREMLLRISGAIQVLEETLTEIPEDPVPDDSEVSTEPIPTEVTPIPG